MMMESAVFSGKPDKKSVKIEFTRQALTKRNILSKIRTKETGFILGSQLGNYKIIEDLFAFRFDSRNINRLYSIFFKHFEGRLIGTFFMNSEYFLNDWFLENIIIRFQENDLYIFLYHLDESGREKMLDQIK
jgi:hypothetical protein